MSLAAPGDVAPLLPTSLALVVVPHACPPATASDAPATYAVTITTADLTIPGVTEPATYPGSVGLRDTVSAIYKVPGATTPDNQDALESLGAQLALDYCSWSLPRFDVSYHGIIGVEPDPLLDGIEFGYDGESGCWTRWWSAPFGDQATEFNHADPADCPGGVVIYTATPKAKVSGTNLVLTKVRVRIAPGGRRFRTSTIGTDSIPLCPSASGGPMGMTTEAGSPMTTEA